ANCPCSKSDTPAVISSPACAGRSVKLNRTTAPQSQGRTLQLRFACRIYHYLRRFRPEELWSVLIPACWPPQHTVNVTLTVKMLRGVGRAREPPRATVLPSVPSPKRT